MTNIRYVDHWQKQLNDRKRGGRPLSSGRLPKNCCFFVLAEVLGQVKTDSWMPLRSINVKLSLNLPICFQHLTIRVNLNRHLHSILIQRKQGLQGMCESCENSIEASIANPVKILIIVKKFKIAKLANLVIIVIGVSWS